MRKTALTDPILAYFSLFFYNFSVCFLLCALYACQDINASLLKLENWKQILSTLYHKAP